MTVDPAAFIVRSGSYPQSLDYPVTCAQIVQELLDQGEAIASLHDMWTYIGKRLQETQPNPMHQHSGYGRQRVALDESVGYTTRFRNTMDPLGDRRQQTREELERPGAVETKASQARSKYIEYHVIEAGDSAEDNHLHTTGLTAIIQDTTADGNVLIAHPGEPKMDAAAVQAFDRAVKGDRAGKKNASLEVYWWLMQRLPIYQGTDTAARIALEYMSHRFDFEVPFVKERKSFGLYAQARELHDFIDGWERGDYFDPKATSEQVLGWQRDYIAQRGPLSRI